MTYRREQEAFQRLRNNCSEDVAREYETAIKTLLEQYNTTIYENRFVVGGAVEIFTCALLRKSGVECIYAGQETGGDLLLPQGEKISIKGSFTEKHANIKLINKLGDGARYWETATLFVRSGIGIVYGDPSMVSEKYVQQIGDGVSLKYNAIKELKKEERNVFPLNLPIKAPKEKAGASRKASVAVAKQILLDMELNQLLTTFPENI